jgi:hypothetical protein
VKGLRAIGDLPLRAQAGARLSLSHRRLTEGRCRVMWMNVPAAETFRYQIRIAGRLKREPRRPLSKRRVRGPVICNWKSGVAKPTRLDGGMFRHTTSLSRHILLGDSY